MAELFDVIAEILSRLRIDHRHRSGHGQTGGLSDGGGRTCGHLNDAVTQPDPGIRHRLPLGQTLPDELDDLGALRELAVIEGVTRPELGEVEDRHVRSFELRPVRLLIGIDGSQAGFAAPHAPGDGQRPVVPRDEQGECRPVGPRPHVDDRLLREIDIDIGCGQKDVTNLRRDRPSRMAIWRRVSRASELPMEWARMEISPTAGSRAIACSMLSREHCGNRRYSPGRSHRPALPREGQVNRIGTTGASESCTICAKRKTASSKRLLNP